MAITQDKRQTQTFVCDGTQKVFPFDFKVFVPRDIGVLVNSTNDFATPDTSLTYETDYSVTLNVDQDNNPGGSVTLVNAPASGTRLVVISSVERLQPIVITRSGGFYPDTLNDGFDRAIALIQELFNKVARCLSVPSTSSQTPEDMTTSLMNAQSTAQAAADAAEAAKDAAQEILDDVQDYGEAAAKLEPIADEIVAVAGAKDAVEATGENITNVNVVAGDLDTTTQPVDVDYGDYDDNTGSGNIETPTGGNIVTVAQNIEAVDTVAENMESILAIEDKIDGLDETVQEMNQAVASAEAARDVAIQASKVAAFAYRYSATPITANGTAPLTNIQPQDNIKVGDHIVDSVGNVFEITVITPATEETEDSPATAATFTVGALLTSIKGAKGDKGDTGYYFTPSVNSDGVISWTNNGNLDNPASVSIRGPKGDQGDPGPQGVPGTTDFNQLTNKPTLGAMAAKDGVSPSDLSTPFDLGEYQDE